MRQTLYGVFAVGLMLFLSNNIYANSTSNCKPSVQIQPVKGNYIPLLNGDVERLEKFLFELAEQNANYCNASLKIDFKKGLESKQTITHGKPKYNEKLYLEVQYVSPSYEAIIENTDGDILHKIELGKELKSIEYSNPKFNNHDALYAEWRRIRRGNFSQIENDVNSFQALIDFLKTENGMSTSESQSLAINEQKEVLGHKGEVAKLEKEEKPTRKSRRKKSKKKSKSKEKNKESTEMAKAKSKSIQKSSTSKVEKESDSKTKIANKESTEMAKAKSIQKSSIPKIEKEFDSKTKVAKKESKEMVEVKPESTQKKSTSKVEKETEAKIKVAKKESEEMAKAKIQSSQENSKPEVEKKSKSKEIEKVVKKLENQPSKSEAKVSKTQFEKTPSKKESSSDREKYLPSVTSSKVVKVKENQPQESSEPREIISDDEMFGNAGVMEPLAEMVRFQFPYGKNYMVINKSDFSIKINTGRESGKIFDDSSIKPKQEKKLKNKFKNGDWYSIIYPEKLHKKDVENYKKSIESILSDLDLSDHEGDFFKMSEKLIPNLDIISSENPLADTSQKEKVEAKFQKFISEEGIEVFKENQQQEAETELKKLLTLIVQSHRLRHYYKYTVGSSAAQRPVNKLPRFRKN